MLSLLITLLVVLIVLAIVYWVFQQIPLPPPFRWIGAAVIGIIAIVVLLSLVPGLHLGALR